MGFLYDNRINYSVLPESYFKKFSNAKNIIRVFYLLKNQHSTASEMTRMYETIHPSKNNDQFNSEKLTGKIRGQMSTWATCAKNFDFPCHENGKEECKNKFKYHRICSKSSQNGTREKLYWIENSLARKLFSTTYCELTQLPKVTFTPIQLRITTNNEKNIQSNKEYIKQQEQQKMIQLFFHHQMQLIQSCMRQEIIQQKQKQYQYQQKRQNEIEQYEEIYQQRKNKKRLEEMKKQEKERQDDNNMAEILISIKRRVL